MTFTPNVRYDHVTVFPIFVAFSVKSSSFALASKARISLFSSLFYFFQENINANPTFAVCRKRDS